MFEHGACVCVCVHAHLPGSRVCECTSNTAATSAVVSTAVAWLWYLAVPVALWRCCVVAVPGSCGKWP
eukprot:1146594-Pelagomonas_calceolata.AAC.4